MTLLYKNQVLTVKIIRFNQNLSIDVKHITKNFFMKKEDTFFYKVLFLTELIFYQTMGGCLFKIILLVGFLI